MYNVTLSLNIVILGTYYKKDERWKLHKFLMLSLSPYYMLITKNCPYFM